MAIGTAIAIGLLASAGASAASSVIQHKAAGKAADQQKAGTDAASARIQQGIDKLGPIYAPYMNSGASAQNTLGRLTTPAPAARYASPGPPSALGGPAPAGPMSGLYGSPPGAPSPPLGSPGGPMNNYIQRPRGPIPMAEGGDMVVDEPTMFLAGEAGPERATFSQQGNETGGDGGAWGSANGMQGWGSDEFRNQQQAMLSANRSAGEAAGQDMGWMDQPGALQWGSDPSAMGSYSQAMQGVENNWRPPAPEQQWQSGGDSGGGWNNAIMGGLSGLYGGSEAANRGLSSQQPGEFGGYPSGGGWMPPGALSFGSSQNFGMSAPTQSFGGSSGWDTPMTAMSGALPAAFGGSMGMSAPSQNFGMSAPTQNFGGGTMGRQGSPAMQRSPMRGPKLPMQQQTAGPYPMAKGGDMMVNRPTLFLAGENGPERATFQPQRPPQGGPPPGPPSLGGMQGPPRGQPQMSALSQKLLQKYAARLGPPPAPMPPGPPPPAPPLPQGLGAAGPMSQGMMPPPPPQGPPPGGMPPPGPRPPGY